MMRNLSKLYILSSLTLCSLPGAAQLHENISVDGKYVPEVIRVERINAFPRALTQTLTTTPIGYESKGVAASFSPSLVTLPATGWRASREISSNPGYLELGVGSWLNSTLSAGYRFVDNQSTLFGIRLQHNSTSLWKPDLYTLTDYNVKQYRYDESLGLYASHLFKGAGRLEAALDYHLGCFNYYGLLPIPTDGDAPGQTINDVALRLKWKSLIHPSTNLEWDAGLRLRHFAYRQMVRPEIVDVPGEAYKAEIYGHEKGGRETNIGLEGSVRMPWDNGSSIGIDASLDVVAVPRLLSITQTAPDFLYYASAPAWNPTINGEPLISDETSGSHNYGLLTLTPYYRFSKGLLDIRLGADVDLAFNAGEKGERYPFLHIAPDVNIALQTGQVGLYLNATGGTTLNTLAYLHQLDYYAMPALRSTRPTHTPLDASFGVNLGPFSGFSLGLKAAYRIQRNVPLGGWYQGWVMNQVFPMEGLTGLGDYTMPLYGMNQEGINLHGGSVSARMAYEYGRALSVSAEGSYQPQDGKKGYFNGYDRARVTARFKLAVRPIEPLQLGLSYDYRGVRKIFTDALNFPDFNSLLINGDGFVTYPYLRLPDLTMLNFSASWDFSEKFGVWLQADNLLNRHDLLLPYQPMQGVVVIAGLKWLF